MRSATATRRRAPGRGAVKALLALCLVAGCAAQDAERAPEEAPQKPSALEFFAPGETYAIVTIDDQETTIGRYLLCSLDRPGRFGVVLDKISECTRPGRSMRMGAFNDAVIGLNRSRGLRLTDGTLLRILRISVTGPLQRGDRPEGGFVLAARQPAPGETELLTGVRPAWVFETGKIHYLGHSPDGRRIVPRAPGELPVQMAEDLADFSLSRLKIDPPQRFRTECWASGRINSCTYEPATGAPFADDAPSPAAAATASPQPPG